MDNTFTRALLGFTLLTSAPAFMALTALWGIAQYGGGASWAAIIVVLLTLAAEIGIYSTTLHDPIYKWIREPAERKRMHDFDLEQLDSCKQAQTRRVDEAIERLRKLESGLPPAKQASSK